METNQTTRKLTSLLYPAAALIAYKTILEDNNSFFLELRAIDEEGNFKL